MRDTAVFVPCYKRPEYTKKCIDSLEKSGETRADFFLVDDGSWDSTESVLKTSILPSVVIINEKNQGLRSAIIDFIERTKCYKYIAKVDSDCKVPKRWLSDCIKYLDEDKADIISPNVYPSNVAFKIGKTDNGDGLRMASYTGGLWVMKRSMIDGIDFEKINSYGIKGAFSILHQIIIEKEARIGWASKVTVEDMGHYSGEHPEHIKSQEHLEYSLEVGRNITWG